MVGHYPRATGYSHAMMLIARDVIALKRREQLNNALARVVQEGSVINPLPETPAPTIAFGPPA